MVNRVRQFSQEHAESDEEELALVVDNLVDLLLKGENQKVSAYLREHHRFGCEIRQIFPVLQMLCDCSRRRRNSEEH